VSVGDQASTAACTSDSKLLEHLTSAMITPGPTMPLATSNSAVIGLCTWDVPFQLLLSAQYGRAGYKSSYEAEQGSQQTGEHGMYTYSAAQPRWPGLMAGEPCTGTGDTGPPLYRLHSHVRCRRGTV
jgi:hypothetical protein